MPRTSPPWLPIPGIKVGNIHGMEARSGEGQGVEDGAVGLRGRKLAQEKTHGRGKRGMARRDGIY